VRECSPTAGSTAVLHQQERLQLQLQQCRLTTAAATVTFGQSGALIAAQPQQFASHASGSVHLPSLRVTLVWAMLQRSQRGQCLGQCCGQSTRGPRLLPPQFADRLLFIGEWSVSFVTTLQHPRTTCMLITLVDICRQMCVCSSVLIQGEAICVYVRVHASLLLVVGKGVAKSI
jgi:hypothetical protein